MDTKKLIRRTWINFLNFEDAVKYLIKKLHNTDNMSLYDTVLNIQKYCNDIQTEFHENTLDTYIE